MQKTHAVFFISAVFIALLFAGCSNAPEKPPQANRPPVIDMITGTREWPPGTLGQFECIASDPDGDTLSYTWVVDNGTLTVNGNSVTWLSPDSQGVYNLTVIVSDGKGGEARAAKELKIAYNIDGTVTEQPLVLQMALTSKETATASKRIRIWMSTPIQCVVEGDHGTNLRYAWTVSNGRLQGKGINEGTASKVDWIAPGVAGAYTVDVVVTDDKGDQARGTATITVFCCGN